MSSSAKWISVSSVLIFATSSVFAQTMPGYEAANALYTKGDYSSALMQFRKLSEKYKTDPSVHYMLGMCYQKLNKPDQAKAELTWVATYSKDPKIKQYALSSLGQSGGGTGVGGISNARLAAAHAIAAPARGAGSNLAPPPNNLINDSTSQTVQTAWANGWKPCPGKCLKLSTPGWKKLDVPGHPDTDRWYSVDGKGSYNQHHAGHLFSPPNAVGHADDIGICPICQGTGWVPR